jgi:hypothetical protein
MASRPRARRNRLTSAATFRAAPSGGIDLPEGVDQVSGGDELSAPLGEHGEDTLRLARWHRGEQGALHVEGAEQTYPQGRSHLPDSSRSGCSREVVPALSSRSMVVYYS